MFAAVALHPPAPLSGDFFRAWRYAHGPAKSSDCAPKNARSTETFNRAPFIGVHSHAVVGGRRHPNTLSIHGPQSCPLGKCQLSLPDLRRVGIVALDTETNDEGLRADRGPAWPWHGGYVCGVNVAWRGRRHSRIYFPLRHPDTDNFDPATGLPLAEGSVRVRCSLRHSERALRLGLAARRRSAS